MDLILCWPIIWRQNADCDGTDAVLLFFCPGWRFGCVMVFFFSPVNWSRIFCNSSLEDLQRCNSFFDLDLLSLWFAFGWRWQNRHQWWLQNSSFRDGSKFIHQLFFLQFFSTEWTSGGRGGQEINWSGRWTNGLFHMQESQRFWGVVPTNLFYLPINFHD